MDTNLIGKLNKWDLQIQNNLNTLNASRFYEAYRSKLILKRSFNLNCISKQNNKDLINSVTSENNYSDFVDFQIQTNNNILTNSVTIRK